MQYSLFLTKSCLMEMEKNLILSLENEQWALILGFAWWIKDVVHAVEGSKSQIYAPFKSQLASYDRKKKSQCSKPNQKWLSPHD